MLGLSKIMLALPVLGAGVAEVSTASLDPSQEFQFFKWALWGAIGGGYCSAATELYRLLTKTTEKWRTEVGLALLQLSISIPFGLFFALWMSSSGDFHHWKTSFLAFLAALVGLVVKPVIEKMSKQAVQKAGETVIGIVTSSSTTISETHKQ